MLFAPATRINSPNPLSEFIRFYPPLSAFIRVATRILLPIGAHNGCELAPRAEAPPTRRVDRKEALEMESATDSLAAFGVSPKASGSHCKLQFIRFRFFAFATSHPTPRASCLILGCLAGHLYFSGRPPLTITGAHILRQPPPFVKRQIKKIKKKPCGDRSNRAKPIHEARRSFLLLRCWGEAGAGFPLPRPFNVGQASWPRTQDNADSQTGTLWSKVV